VDQAWDTANGRTVQDDGSGQTIAIVDAFCGPYVWRNLRTFDRQFGPPDTDFSQ
jgi:subtilase family serine protease